MARSMVSVVLTTFLLMVSPVFAASENVLIGDDLYIAGSGSTGQLTAERDVFATGGAVTMQGEIAEDLHVAGFDIGVEADTNGNVYAVGGAVTLRGVIGKDLSAGGISVRTAPTARTTGNARLFGGTVTIEGPVNGALVVAGGEVILDAVINGDVWITGQSLTFGPEARIGGTLRYASPTEVDVPENVVPADRVTYKRLSNFEMMRDMGETWTDREYPVLPAFISVFAMFVITIAFLVMIGALFLAFTPNLVEKLRNRTVSRPGTTLLGGILGLSALFGLVPVSAMSLVGIPLVPIVVFSIVTMWTLGYVLGVYTLAMRIGSYGAVGKEPKLSVRLVTLAIGLVVVALFNFIPFVGWLANFILVLLGVGAMTTLFIERISKSGLGMDVKPDKA